MIRGDFSPLETTEPVVSPADRLHDRGVWPSDLVIYFTVGAFEFDRSGHDARAELTH